MFLLYFYVPSNFKEIVKEKLFEIGAGKIGNYQRCSFETLGHGQFMPLVGAKPFLGEELKLETVEEFKVEMVVSKDLLSHAIETLRNHHPYEEPAFRVLKHYI
jgi:hypothetical protein